MSDTINLTFPDDSVQSYDRGITGYDLASSISSGLARQALAIGVDGEIRDINRPIEEDAAIKIYTWDNEEGKHTFWHSSAHLMAGAVEEIFPGAKFGIGPAIDAGFYYDIDLGEHKLSQEDLEQIETKMKEIVGRDEPYVRQPVSKEEALGYFSKKGDEYKIELISDLEDGSITLYRHGNFVDLCRGPHLSSTRPIKYFKLLNIAGAYWRGDENRRQLTRIYGISFPKKKALTEHLERLEEAKLRDHRKIGRELELFTFSSKVGPGLPMWLPKGAILRETLTGFLNKEQVKRGYEPVITPHIGKLDLFRTSGHYPYYKDSQFPPMMESEDDGYLLKPMNCPHHTQLYADKLRSYRDLPVRFAEFGTVYRYEQSGELGGLTRVRGFTQDDAHIFCTPDQVKDEFKNVIDLTLLILHAHGFEDYDLQISLRNPDDKEKYVGYDEQWDKAEQAIREAVAEMGLDAVEKVGEASFYGPKLDFMIKDALGRDWQLGTVQIDYNLPERFQLTYIGADDERHRPVMIHRAPFGSLERFVGVLIEHCAGNFPTWLSPVQVIILPIGHDFHEYAGKVASALRCNGLRVEVDLRNEKIGYKIRNAELQKTPYMLILGRRELDNGTVAVRKHGVGAQDSIPLNIFIESIKKEIDTQLRRNS